MRGIAASSVLSGEQSEAIDVTKDLPANVSLWTLEKFIDQAQTGDLIFFHGTTSMGRFIELTGPYSHVAMVMRMQDSENTVMVFEAQESVGFRDITAKRLYTNYWADNRPFNGRAFVFRPRKSLNANEQRLLYRSALNLLGSMYSNSHIDDMILRWINYHLSHQNQRPVLQPEYNHLVCSEATYLLYRSINRSLPYDVHYGDYTPSSEAGSHDLQVQAELSMPGNPQHETSNDRPSVPQLLDCLRKGKPLLTDDKKLQRFSDCYESMKLESAANGHSFFATPRRLGSNVHGATSSFEIDSKMLFGLGVVGVVFLAFTVAIQKGWRCRSARQKKPSTNDAFTQIGL